MLKGTIVKDKINLQEVILPSSMLSDQEIEKSLNRWLILLHQHQIHVVFHQDPPCIRDQYDYMANEFMQMLLPPHPAGLEFCFVYDRVAPDPSVDEANQLIQQLLEDIFRKQTMGQIDCTAQLLHFNDYENLSEPEFRYLIKNGEEKKPAISQCNIMFRNKKMEENALVLTGRYQVGYSYPHFCEIEQGGWEASLKKMTGKWVVEALFIDGF
jgi:hypothetical protein